MASKRFILSGQRGGARSIEGPVFARFRPFAQACSICTRHYDTTQPSWRPPSLLFHLIPWTTRPKSYSTLLAQPLFSHQLPFTITFTLPHFPALNLNPSASDVPHFEISPNLLYRLTYDEHNNNNNNTLKFPNQNLTHRTS